MKRESLIWLIVVAIAAIYMIFRVSTTGMGIGYVEMADGDQIPSNSWAVMAGAGEVIVWAKKVAEAHGQISAKGGSRGGDGGFVETSAKTIDVTADVSVGPGDGGSVGTWLIDPINVDIVETVPVDPTDPFLELFEMDDGLTVTFAPGGEPNTPGPTSFVSAASLEGALGQGGNVVVTTEDCGTTQGITKGVIYRGEKVEVRLADSIRGRVSRTNIVDHGRNWFA